MVSRNGATALKSFKAAVASVLSNMFLIGGSVVLSIHIVLTFFRMHGLLLTLAFVAVWLVSVTGYLQWIQQTSKQPTKIHLLWPKEGSLVAQRRLLSDPRKAPQ